jgi:hypothetical protein
MTCERLDVHSTVQSPFFVNLIRNPGIDSYPGRPGTTSLFDTPARQARLHMLAKSIPRDRSWAPFNVYKYGLSTYVHGADIYLGNMQRFLLISL